MRSKLLLTTIFLFSVLITFAQTDIGGKVDTKLIRVSNKIYMLQGEGGNVGLSFGSDGIFMIDNQLGENIEKVQKDIRTISEDPIRFLVNTHFHEDHTSANAALAKTGTVIIAQENVRESLLGQIKQEAKKISEDILPTVTFSEDLTFYFNGERINVFHVANAHTDGDAMVYFTKNNVLHTGDVFFNEKYPFIDMKNGGTLKGTVEGMRKALKLINQDTQIIPGHGNVATYKDLEMAMNMLEIVYKRVEMNYLKNKTEDEVAKMTDLTTEFDAKEYGTGFIGTDAFLKMMYKSVAESRKSMEANSEKNEDARKKIEQMKIEYEKKNKN